MNKSNHFYLYLAIFIPVMMIIIVAFNFVFYRVELHPKHSFIYLYMQDEKQPYACWRIMQAKVFNLKNTVSDSATIDCSKVKLMEYDFKTQKSKPVTLAEVKNMKLTLPKNSTSPDGFVIDYYCGSSDILSWGWFVSNHSVCVRKGNLSQRLDINSYLFYFLGWKLS